MPYMIIISGAYQLGDRWGVASLIRVVYASASKFKYIAQTLAKINDEGYLVFTPDMFAAYIMSPDKSTMAILRVPPLSFDEFTVDEPINLLIRTDELNKIVKRATRNDDLIFEYDVSQEALKVILKDRKTGLERQFLITTQVDESFKLKEPTPEFSATFTMQASDFKTIIQDAKIVGDIIEFNASEEKVVVRSAGEEKEYEWIMEVGNPLVNLDVTEESKSSYTRSSMEVTTKPTGAADLVKVSFSTDFPLKAEFTFPNGEKLVIYVAPTL